MSNFYIDPTKAEWAASTAYTSGQYVCPTQPYATAGAKRYVYECTTPGTSGGTEPTWVYATPDTSTTSDGGVTWTCRNADSWAKAIKHQSNIALASAATALASGDIVRFKYDSAATQYAGNLSFRGPDSGPPAIFMAADGTTGAYTKATANSIDNAGGAYWIDFDGSHVALGLEIACGGSISPVNDSNEYSRIEDCKLEFGAGGRVYVSGANAMSTLVDNEYDCSADASSQTNAVIHSAGGAGYELIGGFFTACDQRTVSLVNTQGWARVSGVDFSASSMPTTTEPFALGPSLTALNCKLPSGLDGLVNTNSLPSGANTTCINCGDSDRPWYIYNRTPQGALEARSDHYMTGGQSIGGTVHSWQVDTAGTDCTELIPYKTPWINGKVTSTGSKTFSIEVTSDAAAHGDDEVWPELEFLSESGECLWGIASGRRSPVLTGTATDWPSSSATWNGFSPTSAQTVSITATVAQAGQFRLRLCFGTTSTTHHVNPDVTVT